MTQTKTLMNPSTEARTLGKLHEVKGAMQEVAGQATNDPERESSGNVEKNLGKVQQWIGSADWLC